MVQNGPEKNFMNDKCFFDSNMLVYMMDASEPQKQAKARALFSECIANNSAVISTQCLQEFYNVTANKLKQDKLNIKKIIHNYSEHIPTVQISPSLIEKAIDISIQTQFSFWDSLIVSAASYTKCSILYSEDLNDGQIVEGVKIQNPLK